MRDSVLQVLADAACGDHAQRVVEIGPGRGALTRWLLPLTDELHAIEIDRSLAIQLERKFATEAKLQIHNSDVLETDLSQWGPAVIAGNLPYYITSPIIEHFLSLPKMFQRAVFLVQWEVAQRLTAEPGSRDYGFLTVMSNLVCDTRMILKVPADAFHPPPQVDSGAVLFERKPGCPARLAEIRTFISRCFAHKRKTLRNNLRPFYSSVFDTQVDANLRAEQLSVAQLVELFERLNPLPPVH